MFIPDSRSLVSCGLDDVRLWPLVPGLGGTRGITAGYQTKPPLHALPHAELMTKLRAFTNLQVVEEAASSTGYRLEVGPFPGWRDVPTW